MSADALAVEIRALPSPVADPETAQALVGRAEALAAQAPLPADIERRLADVLRFIPKGPPPSWIWPRTWIRAARLLSERELEPLSRSDAPVYLSALGALKLARAGVRNAGVDDWLLSTRDYEQLTADERAELEPFVLALSPAAAVELRIADHSD